MDQVVLEDIALCGTRFKLSGMQVPSDVVEGIDKEIMRQKVSRSNNLPEIPASFYFDDLMKCKSCPEKS